jgi:protein-L-isoaspartate(D-aspartate) O-methyltransferase
VERFYFVPADELMAGAAFQEYEMDAVSSDPSVLDLVYSDEALVTRLDRDGQPSSSTSQPSLVAIMLHLLDLCEGMRVLEIGAGTGYNAALMAELVGDPALVTTIDIQAEVAADAQRLLSASGYGDIRVLCRDGTEGAPEHSPFDRIVATVGCPDISWRWVNQLAADGVMLVPLQHGGPNSDPLVRLRPSEAGGMEGRVVAWSGFMSLQGDKAAFLWPELVDDETTPPDDHFDLFPALSDAPRTMDSYRAGKRAWWDFAYFLALEDPRTHFGRVLALVDPNGDRVVLKGDGIRLWGGGTLFDDLVAAYQSWESLGSPALTEWRVHMTPRTNSPPDYDPETATWVLTRPTSWQIVQLNSPSS